MYQDLLKLRRIMYLGITESKTLPHHSIFIHLAIVILDGEWHAMPLFNCKLPPVYTHPATSLNFMTHNMHCCVGLAI